MALTTRRALFGAGLAVAALAAPAVTIAAPICAKSMTPEQLALVLWAQSFGGDLGLQAAHQAIRAGFDINHASGIGKHGIRFGETCRVVIDVDDGAGGCSFDKDGRRSRTRTL